jgi:hypothetical protein
LASAAATSELQSRLLPASFSLPDLDVPKVMTIWSNKCTGIAPQYPANCKQASWNDEVIRADVVEISSSILDPHHQARWLACQNKSSGAWLHAIPISSCGLRLDDEAIRIAIGLRLGVSLCNPHPCSCGFAADSKGTHGLSCRRNQGRLPRHASFNDIIHRSLVRAGVPAAKEPSGLVRTDGKRPDGATLVPWRNGKCLAWDATAPDTLACSYLPNTSISAGAAAEGAAVNKIAKYQDIIRSHIFVPLAIESMGTINKDGLAFIHEIGRRLSSVTGDNRETAFLLQRLSIANQRYNAVAIRGCFPLDA